MIARAGAGSALLARCRLDEDPEALAIWADGHSFKALIVLTALGWVGGRRGFGQIINWGIV